VILESRSDGQKLAYDLGQLAMSKKPQKIILAVEEVRDWVKVRLYPNGNDGGRLEKPLTSRKAMKAAGLLDPARRATGGGPRYPIGKDRVIEEGSWPKGENPGLKFRTELRMSYIVANFQIGEDEEWKDLFQYKLTPEDLFDM